MDGWMDVEDFFDTLNGKPFHNTMRTDEWYRSTLSPLLHDMQNSGGRTFSTRKFKRKVSQYNNLCTTSKFKSEVSQYDNLYTASKFNREVSQYNNIYTTSKFKREDSQYNYLYTTIANAIVRLASTMISVQL